MQTFIQFSEIQAHNTDIFMDICNVLEGKVIFYNKIL